MTHYHVKGWFRSLLALWFLHASPAGARESAASAPTCCLSKRRAKHTSASRSLARTEGNALTGKGRWEERGLQIGNHLSAHNSDLFVCCHGDRWKINTVVLWGPRGVAWTRWHDYNESGLRLNERDERQKLTKEIRVMATAGSDWLTASELLCGEVERTIWNNLLQCIWKNRRGVATIYRFHIGDHFLFTKCKPQVKENMSPNQRRLDPKWHQVRNRHIVHKELCKQFKKNNIQHSSKKENKKQRHVKLGFTEKDK